MSVMVLTKKHVDTICNHLFWYSTDRFDEDLAAVTRIGQTLVDANLEAYYRRYPDEAQHQDENPEPYRFTPTHIKPAPTFVAFLKLLDCIEYQCDDRSDWEQTEAYRHIQGARKETIRRLDGYNAAPWALD